MTDADVLNRRLVAELTAAGALPDQWRAAFLATPRHLFVPDSIWDDADGGGLTRLRRDDDPAFWLRTVYANKPIVTQVDDGATPDAEMGLLVTSSISKPSIVAAMLGHLQVEPGMRVLEIGTGTGWNAALLAHMVGEGNAFPVDRDRGRLPVVDGGRAPGDQPLRAGRHP